MTDNASRIIAYNSKYGELPIPTRTGYKFVGWFTTLTDGESVNEETLMQGTAYNENASVTNWSATDGTVITLYAQWGYQQTVNVEYEKVEDDTFENKKTVLTDYAIAYKDARKVANTGNDLTNTTADNGRA